MSTATADAGGRGPERVDSGGTAGGDRVGFGSRAASLVPGMAPGSPSRNLFFGAAYLGALIAVTSVAATVATSYRPVRGC